jgi:hypothetical protein
VRDQRKNRRPQTNQRRPHATPLASQRSR